MKEDGEKETRITGDQETGYQSIGKSGGQENVEFRIDDSYCYSAKHSLQCMSLRFQSQTNTDYSATEGVESFP